MRYLFLLALLMLPVANALAADLGDDPKAFDKLPEYVSATKKLSADIAKLPDYVAAMKKVHANFHGTPGTFVCLGDSLTSGLAYWTPLKDTANNLPPAAQQDYIMVKKYMKPECWTWKGAKYGNEGGMCANPWGKDNIDKWLKEMNPEAVMILFGSNDMDARETPQKNFQNWEEAMTEMTKKCLDNGTVVILSTIPPRSNRRCDVYSERLIKIAGTFNVPVCDLLGACISARPTDWNGHLPQFVQDPPLDRFEVPTIICGDGEHLSHPKKYANDYSDDALKHSGDNLRTLLTLTSYGDVVHKVFGVPLPAGK